MTRKATDIIRCLSPIDYKYRSDEKTYKLDYVEAKYEKIHIQRV